MKNLIWSLLTNFGLKVFMMIFNIYIANSIGVAEFGSYILIISLLTLVTSFAEGGVIYSLIRKRTTNNKDYFNCLLISLSFSLLGFVLFFLIVSNFKFPIHPMIIVLCFIYLFSISFNYIQLAFLERNMRFREIFNLNGISFFLSTSITLIVLSVNNSILVPIILFTTQPFFFFILGPKKHILKNEKLFSLYNVSIIKEHLVYGKYILLGSVLNAGYNNFFNFFVNYKLNTGSLAILERSKTYSEFLSSLFGLSVSKVIYPKICAINDRKVFEGVITKKIIAGIVLFIPITAIISLVIEDLIKLLYNEEWWNVIPYLRYLILCSFLSVSGVLIQLIFRVENQNYQSFKNEVVKKVFIISLIIVASFFGVDEIIYAVGIGIIASFFINLYFVNKFISISLYAILKRTVVPVLASFLMYFGFSTIFNNFFIVAFFYSSLYCILILLTNRDEFNLIIKIR